MCRQEMDARICTSSVSRYSPPLLSLLHSAKALNVIDICIVNHSNYLNNIL
jgi:hypothetical protein